MPHRILSFGVLPIEVCIDRSPVDEILDLEEKLVSALSVADLSHKVAVVRSLVYLCHDKICFYGLKVVSI